MFSKWKDQNECKQHWFDWRTRSNHFISIGRCFFFTSASGPSTLSCGYRYGPHKIPKSTTAARYKVSVYRGPRDQGPPNHRGLTRGSPSARPGQSATGQYPTCLVRCEAFSFRLLADLEMGIRTQVSETPAEKSYTSAQHSSHLL